MRITKHRKQILELFETEGDNLLSAEIVSQKLKDKQIDLSTVYRTLEVFFKEGLLCRSVIENTAFYYLVNSNHQHYVICVKCHRRFKIKCQFKDIIDNEELYDNFIPTHHDLTIYGHCRSCR